EDRNRTYLATCMATTVLKTARATRHPSLSRSQIETRSLPSLARRCPSRLCLLSRRSLASAANCKLPISDSFACGARFGVRRLEAAFENATHNTQLKKPES